jgi:CheY-like chemotaxis protein
MCQQEIQECLGGVNRVLMLQETGMGSQESFEFLDWYFRNEGRRVDFVRHGISAYRAVENPLKFKYDLFIMGLVCPPDHRYPLERTSRGLNTGVEVLSDIRRLEKGRDLPTIVLTGLPDPPAWERVKEEGVLLAIYPISHLPIIRAIPKLLEGTALGNAV